MHSDKGSQSGIDFTRMALIAIVLIVVVGVSIMMLTLVDRSEKTIQEIKDTKGTFRAADVDVDQQEYELTVKRDLETKPKQVFAKYADFELSDRAIDYICQMKDLQVLLLNHSTITDQQLKRLIHLPIAQFGLSETGITDDAMDDLAKVKTLRQIDLRGSKITDEGIKKLHPLAGQMRTISLGGPSITNKSLEYLRDFKNLQGCDLSMTNVSPDALTNFVINAKMKVLWMRRPHLSKANLKDIGAKGKLIVFCAKDSDLTDDDVASIAAWPGLLKLELLDNPAITNRGAAALKEMRNLKELRIEGCQVTDDYLTELQKALPNCKIMGNSIYIPKTTPEYREWIEAEKNLHGAF